ncbi:hypothetical protein TWF730_010555 [Orbilia blumenaviensis]|uniref:Uncharacterized protein n=1 Tax=Orbilia blumenaviensis TaxID=1796055 RepID=A0AAV9US09_9PEZI
MVDVEKESLYPALPQVVTTPPPSTNLITPLATQGTDRKSPTSPTAILRDELTAFLSEDPIPLTTTTVTPDPTPRLPAIVSKNEILTSPTQRTATIPLLSPSEIAVLSPTSLREQLTISQTHVSTLQRLAEESRAAARHWMLQHKMLETDYTNEKHRYEVEIALAKREVEVLRGRGGTGSANNSFGGEDETEKLRERLARAKNLILEERAAKKDLEDMVERLKKRIRDNRKHDNMVDRAILHVEASRGLKRSESGLSTTSQQREDGLAALGEVASQVLMEQEARAGSGTPKKTAQTPQRGSLVSPIEMATVIAGTPSKKRRRRKSRDSTISASDGEVPTVVNTPARKVQRKEGSVMITAVAAAGLGASPGTPKKARAAQGATTTPRSAKKKASSGKLGAGRSPLMGGTDGGQDVREAFGAALRYTGGDGT